MANPKPAGRELNVMEALRTLPNRHREIQQAF
jgi:hypothetical protein